MTGRDHTRDTFNARAAGYHERNYESPASRHAENLWQRRQAVWTLLGEATGRCLDIGCGPGSVCVPLASREFEVVAVDISPRMVAEAGRLAREADTSAHVGLGVADATRLPFRDGSFDTVVSTGVIEYVPDTARVLSEISRVLRPGATAILTVSLPQRLESFALRCRDLLSARSRTRPVAHRAFRAREFDESLVVAGFELVSREAVYLVPFPLDLAFPKLSRVLHDRARHWLAPLRASRMLGRTYIVKARKLS